MLSRAEPPSAQDDSQFARLVTEVLVTIVISDGCEAGMPRTAVEFSPSRPRASPAHQSRPSTPRSQRAAQPAGSWSLSLLDILRHVFPPQQASGLTAKTYAKQPAASTSRLKPTASKRTRNRLACIPPQCPKISIWNGHKCQPPPCPGSLR